MWRNSLEATVNDSD